MAYWRGNPNVIRNKLFRRDCRKMAKKQGVDSVVVFLFLTEKADCNGQLHLPPSGTKAEQEMENELQSEWPRLIELANEYNLLP